MISAHGGFPDQQKKKSMHFEELMEKTTPIRLGVCLCEMFARSSENTTIVYLLNSKAAEFLSDAIRETVLVPFPNSSSMESPTHSHP